MEDRGDRRNRLIRLFTAPPRGRTDLGHRGPLGLFARPIVKTDTPSRYACATCLPTCSGRNPRLGWQYDLARLGILDDAIFSCGSLYAGIPLSRRSLRPVRPRGSAGQPESWHQETYRATHLP